MKITSNSQLLASLGSLVDTNQREAQQQLVDQQQLKEQQAQARQQVRESDRQEQIRQNREALKKSQEELRARNLDKLRQSLPAEGEAQGGRSSVNLNLRESVGGSSGQPAFERLGQIVDIKI
ncbi:hypothetical protein [Emcibacter nanhaiensis]|uniref:Uncharacterized protein n=1 Tax=Emcibacter nanhaiensis TaxID=1505037 RepID=A0A501PP86_9PROT|nr:hypothetical protein [Emcibacter nanhaiensis]TPD61581.1 hypothetical protein FIV46_05060 [Emcibacter nanhaiensis]